MDTQNADTFCHRWRCGRLSRLARLCCKPGEMMGTDKSAATHGGPNTSAVEHHGGGVSAMMRHSSCCKSTAWNSVRKLIHSCALAWSAALLPFCNKWSCKR
jgi:hypothetical protein